MPTWRGANKSLILWYYYTFYWILLIYQWISAYLKLINYHILVQSRRWTILSSPKCHKIGRYKILQRFKIYKYIFFFNFDKNIWYLNNYIYIFKALSHYNQLINFNLGWLYSFKFRFNCNIHRYICVNITFNFDNNFIYCLCILFCYIFFNFFFYWRWYLFTSDVFYSSRAQILVFNTTSNGTARSRGPGAFAVYRGRTQAAY